MSRMSNRSRHYDNKLIKRNTQLVEEICELKLEVENYKEINRALCRDLDEAQRAYETAVNA